jgi:hypothetical protein
MMIYRLFSSVKKSRLKLPRYLKSRSYSSGKGYFIVIASGAKRPFASLRAQAIQIPLYATQTGNAPKNTP